MTTPGAGTLFPAPGPALAGPHSDPGATEIILYGPEVLAPAAAVPAPATTVTGPDTFGDLAVVGTGLGYAREDHDHGLPNAADAATTVTGPDAYGDAPVVGTGLGYAREDHDHGLPGSSDIATVLGAGDDAGGANLLNVNDLSVAVLTPAEIHDPGDLAGTIGQVPVADGTGTWAWDSVTAPAPASPLQGSPGNAGTSGGAVAYANASGDTAGDATLTGGGASTGQTAGKAKVIGGLQANGNGGAAEVTGGHGTSGHAGGSVVLTGGTSASRTPASITVQGADDNGGGADGLILVTGLPTSDPGIPGALYTTAGAVMVSL